MSIENKKTILLVEDETVTSIVTSKTLQKFGYNVVTAETGEMAIETAKSNKNINLILMDIDLGKGIDGTEAAAIILKGQDIPVVFLSSHTEPEVVGKTEKITSYGYVVKNSSNTVLDASIKMAFKLFKAMKREKDKEAKLHESEEKYRNLIVNISDLIYEIDSRGVIKYLSPSVKELLGYDSNDAIGKNFIEFVYEDDRSQLIKRFSELKDGIEIPLEYRFIKKTGDVIWVRTRTKPIYKDGVFSGANGLLIDITEHKNMEEILRESEERYRAISESSHNAICIVNDQAKISWVNNEMLTIGGYSHEELLGAESFAKFIAPESIEFVVSNFYKVLSGLPYEHIYTFYFIRSDGKIRLCEKQMMDFKDKNGKFNLIISMIDITERKQAEDKLREREEQYRLLSEHMTETVWLMDMNFNITYQSPSVEKLRGFTAQEIMEMPLDQHVTPESFKLVSEIILKDIPRAKSDPGYNPVITLELEYYRNDGKQIQPHSR